MNYSKSLPDDMDEGASNEPSLQSIDNLFASKHFVRPKKLGSIESAVEVYVKFIFTPDVGRVATWVSSCPGREGGNSNYRGSRTYLVPR